MKKILAMLLFPAIALAQPDDPALRAKVRDRVRQEVITRLTTTVGMDAPTAQKFRAVLDAADARIAELQKENGAAFRELKQLVDSGRADAAGIDRLADRIFSNREKIAQLETQRAHDVRLVVTPLQYGQLILATPKIQKEVRKELWKAMAHGEAPEEP